VNDGEQPSHVDCDWDPGPHPELDEKLRRSFDAHVDDMGDDETSWRCPRCNARHVRGFTRDKRLPMLAPAKRGPRSGELAARCHCEHPHANRPEGEVGCGFRAVLKIREVEE
jgi:hypothetical protein